MFRQNPFLFQKKIKFLITFFFLFFPLLVQAKEYKKLSWKTLLPGFSETTLITEDSLDNKITLQLYKIDLKKYRIQVVQAKDFQRQKMSAKDFSKKSNAILAINGGFFDPSYQSLGLIVQNGKIVNPLRQISWWGVFSIDQNHIPRVEKVKDFKNGSNLEMAIQAGPRLIEEGKPVSAKPNVSQKTFLGITPENEVIIGVTDGSVLNAIDFVEILSNQLLLKSALNLDGGGSTQLYVKTGSYEKNLLGFTEVANGVVVVPR